MPYFCVVIDRRNEKHRYVDILQPGPVRRDLLRDHFFFDCACRRCCISNSSTSSSSISALHGRCRLPCDERNIPDQPRRREISRPGQIATPPNNLSNESGQACCDNDDADEKYEEEEEDMVAGGWVCPKRACCGRGRILRPSGDTACMNSTTAFNEHDKNEITNGPGAFNGGVGENDVVIHEESKGGGGGGSGESMVLVGRGVFMSEEAEKNGELDLASNILGIGSGAWCRSCRGFTEEAYFDRWEELLGAKLTAADRALAHGDARIGAKKLRDLQVGRY